MLDISLGIPFEINFQFSPDSSACTGAFISARARAGKNIEKNEGKDSFSNFPKKIKMENNRSVGRRATETRSNVPRSFNYPAPSGEAYRSTVERRS